MLKPRVHILLMTALLIVASAAAFGIMSQTDPYEAFWAGLVGVYSLLFLAIFALTTITGYFFRVIFWQSGVRFEFFRSARRQGAFFGLLGTAIIFLQSREIFSWWTGALLILGFALAEFYFLAR